MHSISGTIALFLVASSHVWLQSDGFSVHRRRPHPTSAVRNDGRLLLQPPRAASSSSHRVRKAAVLVATGRLRSTAVLDQPASDERADAATTNARRDGDDQESPSSSSPPPSPLSELLDSLSKLPSGSDIRGQYVSHDDGAILNVVNALSNRPAKSPAALTPFAARCFGAAFGRMMKDQMAEAGASGRDDDDEVMEKVVCIGRDPRDHGVRLCDAFARGVVESGAGGGGVKVHNTGIATTPAMFEFCRSDLCDGGVMVTASHLPSDRNGLKFFTKDGGFTKADIETLVRYASDTAKELYDVGIMPPSSSEGNIFCSQEVDFMPLYAAKLRDAIVNEANRGREGRQEESDAPLPLSGLRIIVNSGNGSGGFFNQLLKDLGADVTHSMHIDVDSTFPHGIPNPENPDIVAATTAACEEHGVDLGIMFDTDADRCGFVVPANFVDGKPVDYQPLNRNRLIALLAKIFSETSPACTS